MSDISIQVPDKARSTVSGTPLSPEELKNVNGFWQAACFIGAGMIYLKDNPILANPLKKEDVKKRLLGHWGSSPGQAFIWTHLSRIIKKKDLDMIYLSGPGHGAPGVLGPLFLEGTYSEFYGNISPDADGMLKFFKQFSFPGGIGSHCTPETPGSIHEGGELGYSLSHGYGAVFDNPDLIAAVVVGDGEAETGPLATAWHSNKFLNPVRDGAVLPILHLNGYKINNPTILARMKKNDVKALFTGYGYKPYFVEGSDPETMHQAMAATLERCIKDIKKIQTDARSGKNTELPHYPMIILRSPKGWTAPKEVDGLKIEGFWRAHQVPLSGMHENPEHLEILEKWLRSYHPEEVFDEKGRLKERYRSIAPEGNRRMGSNPHANGGLLCKDLIMPDFRKYGKEFDKPGTTRAENTRSLGVFLRDVMNNNMENFRVFGPDETTSNRINAVYEASKKFWIAERFPEDENG
ncbi:MAG: phosphoketolase family protein, partial [Spirochaetales bacterium]|nr:phosphoketolase family protein [Spirochaetales bacterium]